MKRLNLLTVSFFTVFMVIGFASVSFAEIISQTREHPSIMRSVTALGMGNAYYGLSDSKFAPFYNPAGLGDVEKWSVDILPVTAGVNQFFIDRGFNVLKDVISNTDKLTDANYIKDNIVKLAGGYHYFGPVSFFPAFTMKNFTVGLFSNNDFDLVSFNVKVMPQVALRVKSDNGVAIGYAHQFLDDSLSVGIAAKGIYRISFTKSYTAVELAGLLADGSQTMEALKKEIQNEGMGWGILGTVGATYKLPSFGSSALEVLKLKFGLSFNDFGYTDFGYLMEKINPTLNASISIAPSWKFISGYLAVEFNDLLYAYDVDNSFGKRVNIGAQIGFWDHIFLRGGLHQGYPTVGAGVDLWFVRINYAYYTEELGAYPGQYPDKRHALEFIIGI